MPIELKRFETKREDQDNEKDEVGKLFFASFGYNPTKFYSGGYYRNIIWYCAVGEFMKTDDIDRFNRIISYLRTLSPKVQYGLCQTMSESSKIGYDLAVAINFPSVLLKKLRLVADKYKNTSRFDL